MNYSSDSNETSQAGKVEDYKYRWSDPAQSNFVMYSFELEGSKGKATVHVTAKKHQGAWQAVDITANSGSKTVSILPRPTTTPQ